MWGELGLVMACTLLERLSFSPSYDNFILIRYIAAFCVILGHSYPIAKGIDTTQPLSDITGGMSVSALGLAVFFVISGFLLAQSWSRDSSLRFFWKRFLRLYPELIAVIFFTVFVIGPLNTDLSMSDYFSNELTWDYFKHLTLFIYEDSLPGVFTDNPYPRAVNGSLWVLPYFLMMYIALFLFGILGLLNRPPIILITCMLAFIMIIFYSVIFPPLLKIIFIPFMSNTSLLQFYFYFFGGVLLYLYREVIVLDYKIIIFFSIIFLLLIFSVKKYILYYNIIILIYFVIYLSFLPLGFLRKFVPLIDFSYGLFIYSFPIQQTIAHFFIDINSLQMFIATLIVTFPIAYISMYFIGRPALKLKAKASPRFINIDLWLR